MSVHQLISSSATDLAVLVDPDKAEQFHLEKLCGFASAGLIQHFFVGGSLLFQDKLIQTVDLLKSTVKIPVTIFPGNPSQIYSGADAILLLSLVSGRNPDLLIGRHVEAAPLLKKSGLEIISTAYILIDGGIQTTVSYISNTTPIPTHKPEIAAATAMAAEMLGMSCIYLEAGSGAKEAVSVETVLAVRAAVEIPIIVGGGIRSAEQASKLCKAGANTLVVGTAFESNPHLIAEIAEAMEAANTIKQA